MFNAPRPVQPYGSGSTNLNGFGGSFVDENPLASSVYDDGLDPWSAAPSPSPPPAPAAPSSNGQSLFKAVISDALVPPIYHKAFAAVDPTGSGDTTVNALSRVLQTSLLPAGTIDKIISLVSNKPRVSQLEFFVALALVALAQTGKDVSIEQVAALASQNTLPEPSLHLDSLPSSTTNVAALQFARQNPIRETPNRAPTYNSENPWNGAIPGVTGPPQAPYTGGASVVAGSGLPDGWWRNESTVQVNLLGLQGFILNRYTVYEVVSDRGAPVSRRYSEFAFLWDCLVRRYPFRLLPALPPKRIGPDEHFIELRRRGLARFLNYVANHPIIRDDGVLAAFLTEGSFEQWRKHTPITLEEESAGKRVDRVEEMAIPSDLDDKLQTVRAKLPQLIEQWQRICILAERIIKRREAAAADLSRLTTGFRVLNEVNQPMCWRGDGCELANGLKQGIETVAQHLQTQADLVDQRTQGLQHGTLEALKAQRDLYIAMRDLFFRQMRLSIDQVERLKKRVESTQTKLNSIRDAQKDGWGAEAEKLVLSIETDQTTITAQLNRRVYIRACMWHELRVVLHNREHTLLALAIQAFARDERAFAQAVANNWESLEAAVEDMAVA